jgi:hypothetical protein
MSATVIEPNSQAARYLVRRIGALASGRKLSIEVRAAGVAFKVGEEAWTTYPCHAARAD